MAPAWPSSGGVENQGARMPGSVGALASRPRAKIRPTRNQGPDDSRIRRRTQGGRGRDTEAWRDPIQAIPPGGDRDIGAGRRRQRWEQTGTGNGDRCRHAARGIGKSGGGWRVAGAGNVQVGIA